MRTIVKDPRFETELSQLIPAIERADEFVSGAEWALSRDPTIGKPIGPNSKVRSLACSTSPGYHPAVIFYTFNDTQVAFLSIQIVEKNGRH